MSEPRTSPKALRAMLKKAEKKLQSAQREFNAGSYDDASSRAYYAAFHAVSALFASHGLSYSSHSKVLGEFNRQFVKTGIFPLDSFRKLQRLFENRQIGDYDAHRSIDQDSAQTDIADAKLIMEACRQYLEKKTGLEFSMM